MPFVKHVFAFFLDIIETILVALSVFVVVYLFFLQPHEVVGPSMFPNFHDKEYILTDKFSYCHRTPNRGEVVIFNAPESPDKDFIKRVIGLPLETITVEDGKVFINDKALKEDYLPADLRTYGGQFLKEGQDVQIPQDSYAVFGDNRLNSSDTRSWGFIKASQRCGFVGSSPIIGRALLVYWPPPKARFVPSINY